MKKPQSLPNRWFWLTLLIPVIILLSMTVKPLLTLTNGKQIALQTVPYDPRDLFYGEYVDLRLTIERVEEKFLTPELLTALKNPKRSEGIPVYVILEPQGNIYGVKQVTMKKPTTDLYLNGIIDPYLYHELNNTSKPTYWIDYQLDRYYVEEKTGLQLEEWSRQGNLIAYLKVKDGYAILTDLKKAP